ncbi:MAG: hypothetical protein JNK61_03710 [Bacteroidia bacterium]|nr:hypothetical protein [Bacteroidia bacterium]HQV01512.1 hypothetical protein [Bacteroidia bacterium]
MSQRKLIILFVFFSVVNLYGSVVATVNYCIARNANQIEHSLDTPIPNLNLIEETIHDKICITQTESVLEPMCYFVDFHVYRFINKGFDHSKILLQPPKKQVA